MGKCNKFIKQEETDSVIWEVKLLPISTILSFPIVFGVANVFNKGLNNLYIASDNKHIPLQTQKKQILTSKSCSGDPLVDQNVMYNLGFWAKQFSNWNTKKANSKWNYA